MPDVFDLRKDNWAAERAELRDLLGEEGYSAAALTTINAHFTDPAYVREIWAGLERLGFVGGRVLEPGAGAGTFIGLAPETASMIGVELDPTTAMIAKALYPHADIRTESFVETRLRGEPVDAVIGNDLSVIKAFQDSEFGRAMEADVANNVTAAMVASVATGAAQGARIDGIDVAGKTGTAENGDSDPYTLWFTGFAPASNPEIAVAVVVEVVVSNQ